MAGVPAHILDELRARVDLVELVGQYVALKRAGNSYKGLCPFHTERTPSFTVNPKRGIFHCFGCGAGGDAIAFLMRQDRLSFPEAVRALAERTGVVLPDTRGPAEASGVLETLRRVTALAAEFYAETLWGRGGERAREYLARRGIGEEVARRFGLGFAPDGWNALLARMAQAGIGEDLLLQAGLVKPRQTGSGFYDAFRSRLIFPIRDAQGRVIAFGGRALAGEEPKYLNSPETPLYVKGQTLYGLDLARPAMRERRRAILVEGYVDCVMAHQHGFTETVAALGTAFTPAQLALLRRQVDEVIALFDADTAGQQASARLEEMLAEPLDIQDLGWAVARTGPLEKQGAFSIKVATLPAGHDPDSLLRAQGAEALHERLEAARSLLLFVLDRVLGTEDLSTARGRAAAHARVTMLLAKVTNAEEATALAREAARRLGVDATQLWIEAQQLHGARGRARQLASRPAPSAPSSGAWPPPSLAERDLLALLLQVQEARTELLGVIEDEDIAHPGLRKLLTALKKAPTAPPEALMADLETDAERGLLSALLVDECQSSDTLVVIDQLKRRYDIRRRKQRVRQVSQAIAQAQASGDPTLPALEAELRSLQREAEAVRELALTRSAFGPPNAPR